MAFTLLAVVQHICRKVGLDPTITSFSDTDETNDIVQDVNEAYEDLVSELPDNTPFIFATSSITTSSSTRLYNLAADCLASELHEWSIEDETNNDNFITLTTREYIQETHPGFDEDTGKPVYAYLEGNNQIGFYPVPDGTYTVNYSYKKIPTARLSATTDSFLFPDRWVRYIEKKAQAEYEDRKGFANWQRTEIQANDLYADIIAEIDKLEPGYFQGNALD